MKCGSVNNSLSNRNPGKLSHARWVTTANRILRAYVPVAVPSQNLKTLAEFVAKVYGPQWFSIKSNPEVAHGNLHFLSTIKKIRFLPEEVQKLIQQSLKRNSFFAHPENVILSLMCNEDMQTRRNALRIYEIACSNSKSFQSSTC